MITVNHIKKSFKQNAILKGVAFSCESGEIVGLLGASGCGKTTLLRLIAGFETADSGEVKLANRKVEDDGKQLIETHLRDVGFVFQDWSLLAHLTVAENIQLGLHKAPKAQAQARTTELLSIIGLEGYEARYPTELSGGQQQRVALARSIAAKPRILLLDEPFSNLDKSFKSAFIQTLRNVLKEEHMTALCVTHDHEDTFAFCDKAMVLHEGLIEQYDTPHTLYHHPETQLVGDTMGFGYIHPSTQQYTRPEHYQIASDGDEATVVATYFEGATVLLTCKDKSGHEIWIRVLSTAQIEVGDSVTVAKCSVPL